MSGCLGGDEDEGHDETREANDEPSDDGGDNEPSDGGSDDESGESVGTAEITFLDETYTYDDASCEESRTFPPENEMIRHRDVDDEIEFWVERHDPAESDVVDVHLSFPTGDPNETIGEVEAYDAQTTVGEIEFELGSGTSGSLHLEPSSHMNDDVEHDPDGGEVTWEIAC